MDSLQIIHSPKGEEMVVLPLAEYERLITFYDEDGEDEDAEDARLANEQIKKIKSGKVKTISFETIKKKMGGGVHPVRSLREWRGLTAEALAKKSKVGRVTITHIENRTRKGTVENYQALAKALGVKVDNVVEWSDR